MKESEFSAQLNTAAESLRHVSDLYDSRIAEYKNERYWTGCVANAVNYVTLKDIVATHQACIGLSNTHSDVSARSLDAENKGTLLICEFKKFFENDKLIRAQVVNEFMRHRTHDKRLLLQH